LEIDRGKDVDNLIPKLKDFFWPFHQVTYTPSDWDSLDEYEKETYRLRNRWQLIHMRPFIVRWLITAAIFFTLSAVANETGHLIGGLGGYILFMVIWSGFIISCAMTVFLLWVYSFRPK